MPFLRNIGPFAGKEPAVAPHRTTCRSDFVTICGQCGRKGHRPPRRGGALAPHRPPQAGRAAVRAPARKIVVALRWIGVAGWKSC
ncbi:hypothetical protein DLJ53_28575 [Acuticoccus sediminis]|uniref:Uncharacterized protein n=1 Tax=Acuticoccus sediminis TaxID=2184697 RepID=A0A8B2NMT4_9HYPH|nr:hypothetical protein DLJ53_28575 [Acuticoccus sediminis]